MNLFFNFLIFIGVIMIIGVIAYEIYQFFNILKIKHNVVVDVKKIDFMNGK